MGSLSNIIRTAANKAASLFSRKGAKSRDFGAPTAPSMGKAKRGYSPGQFLRSRERMIHESKSVLLLPEMRRDDGTVVPARYIVQPGKGSTYNVGRNAAKREADRLGVSRKSRLSAI